MGMRSGASLPGWKGRLGRTLAGKALSGIVGSVVPGWDEGGLPSLSGNILLITALGLSSGSSSLRINHIQVEMAVVALSWGPGRGCERAEGREGRKSHRFVSGNQMPLGIPTPLSFLLPPPIQSSHDSKSEPRACLVAPSPCPRALFLAIPTPATQMQVKACEETWAALPG